MNYQMHPDMDDTEAALEAAYEVLFKPLVKK
jgi:hypothetical protein